MFSIIKLRSQVTFLISNIQTFNTKINVFSLRLDVDVEIGKYKTKNSDKLHSLICNYPVVNNTFYRLAHHNNKKK